MPEPIRYEDLHLSMRASDSYMLFYPRAQYDDILDTIVEGAEFGREIAVQMRHAGAERFEDQGERYVLHPERTGFWVLAPSNNRPGKLHVCTFYRFHLADTYRFAVQVFGEGKSITAGEFCRWKNQLDFNGAAELAREAAALKRAEEEGRIDPLALTPTGVPWSEVYISTPARKVLRAEKYRRPTKAEVPGLLATREPLFNLDSYDLVGDASLRKFYQEHLLCAWEVDNDTLVTLIRNADPANDKPYALSRARYLRRAS